jgi:hypothetical protein
MMRDVRLWVAIGGFAVATWLVAPFILPCRAPPASDASAPEIRYVCRTSGEVFTLPLAGELVAHPGTGELSLVPAVYDERRKRWCPGPPLEVMRQQGLLGPAP